MNGDIKIGKLLCDQDIITKRQLNIALQAQIKGDKRALGEILVDRGFCTLDDITEVIIAQQQEVKQEEVVEISVYLAIMYTGKNFIDEFFNRRLK